MSMILVRKNICPLCLFYTRIHNIVATRTFINPPQVHVLSLQIVATSVDKTTSIHLHLSFHLATKFVDLEGSFENPIRCDIFLSRIDAECSYYLATITPPHTHTHAYIHTATPPILTNVIHLFYCWLAFELWERFTSTKSEFTT